MATEIPYAHKVLATATISSCDVLGISNSDISILFNCARKHLEDGIDPESELGELAKMVVYICKFLLTYFGGDKGLAHGWFNTYNEHFDSTPHSLVKTVGGAQTIIEYLTIFKT